MSNFINLCINEFIKILKKKSTLVFISITILALIFCIFFKNLSGYQMSPSANPNNKKVDQKEFLTAIISSLNKDIKALENTPKEKQDIEYKKNLNQKKATIYYYKYALNNNISLFSFKGLGDFQQRYFKFDVISNLIKLQTALYNIEDKIPVATNISEIRSKINLLNNILYNEDYNKYIDFKKQEYQTTYKKGKINRTTKDVYFYMLDIDKKYELTKYPVDSNLYKYYSHQNILEYKSNIINNKLLSYEETKILKDKINIELYCTKNGISLNQKYIVNDADFYIELCEYVLLAILAVFLLINSSSNISKEFSKGTIKQLFISPNKRYKIMLAKIVTLTLILVTFSIVLSLSSQLIANLIFKNARESPYVYISNGTIKSINPVIYNLIRFLIDDIEIFVFMLFSIMLSTVTKNTAISTALSVFIYISKNSFMQYINQFINRDWIRFIPFNNFNLANRIFKYHTGVFNYLFETQNFIINNISLQFSFLVIFTCIVLMLSITFYSFNSETV